MKLLLLAVAAAAFVAPVSGRDVVDDLVDRAKALGAHGSSSPALRGGLANAIKNATQPNGWSFKGEQCPFTGRVAGA